MRIIQQIESMVASKSKSVKRSLRNIDSFEFPDAFDSGIKCFPGDQKQVADHFPSNFHFAMRSFENLDQFGIVLLGNHRLRLVAVHAFFGELAADYKLLLGDLQSTCRNHVLVAFHRPLLRGMTRLDRLTSQQANVCKRSNTIKVTEFRITTRVFTCPWLSETLRSSHFQSAAKCR